MDLTTWLLFAATETALCLTPGPATIYVFSQGLARGQRAALAGNAGIVTGNTLYFILSATGLGALILTSHSLFVVVKWVGAAYLIWLGLTTIFGRARALEARCANETAVGHVWRGGVIIQLANPKNLVFFMAILPQFVDPTGNVALQILILGITSQAIEFLVLLGYGAMGGRAHRLARIEPVAIWIDRLAGSLLIAVGTSLAFLRRSTP